MRKLLTLLILLLTYFSVHAQEKNNIAVSYGFGSGAIRSYGKSSPDNFHKQKSLNIFGISYWYKFINNLFLETGVQLIRYNYLTPSTYQSGIPSTNVLNIISVPFKLRYNVGNYVFFTGGITADVSKSQPNNISGLGIGLGMGLQTKVVKSLSLFVSPQININGMVPNNDFFAKANLAFGVSYEIKKQE